MPDNEIDQRAKGNSKLLVAHKIDTNYRFQNTCLKGLIDLIHAIILALFTDPLGFSLDFLVVVITVLLRDFIPVSFVLCAEIDVAGELCRRDV